MKNTALRGNPYDGNPHIRFDEGEVASYPPATGRPEDKLRGATPRRGSLFYNARKVIFVLAVAACSSTRVVLGADFIVKPGSPMTYQTVFNPSSPEVYENVTVNDAFTVTGAGVMFGNTGDIVIGGEAMAPVQLIVRQGAYWVSGAKKSIIFKGRGGNIDLSSNVNMPTGWDTVVTPIGNLAKGELAHWGVYSKIELDSKAISDSGEMNIITIGTRGKLNAQYVKNSNPDVVAKVTFWGGCDYKFWSEDYTFYQTANGAKIVLAVGDKNPIDLQLINNVGSGPTGLFCGDGVLETVGKGDFKYTGGDSGASLSISSDRGEIQWRHTGDTYFSGRGTVRIDSDDVLPWGEGTGLVKIGPGASDTNPTHFDLNGHFVRVNGLLGNGGSANRLENSSSQAARVRFIVNGDVALSAIFTALVASGTGVIHIEKSGSGKLIVDRQLPNDLVIVDGPFEITINNPCPNGTVRYGEGGVWLLGADNLPFNTDAKRAQIALPTGMGSAMTVRKIGSNTVFCSNCGAVEGPVKVEGGTFSAVSANGRSDKFWRLTLKDTAAGNVTYLESFRLFAADGSLVSGGLTSVSDDTVPSDLAPGTCCSPTKGYRPRGSNPYDGIQGVFSTDYYETEFFPPSQRDDSKTWHEIVFRLPDTAAPVVSYGIGVVFWSDGGFPTAWMLESSADGHVWEVVDDRVTTKEDEKPRIQCGNYSGYNFGVPYPLAGNGVDTAVFDKASTVEVTTGATLDLSCVADANLSLHGLTIDVDRGPGTITKFKPAANGVLDLVGESLPSPGGEIKSFSVPMRIDKFVSPEILSTWRVRVNGLPVYGRVSYLNGAFKVSTGGTIISIR